LTGISDKSNPITIFFFPCRYGSVFKKVTMTQLEKIKKKDPYYLLLWHYIRIIYHKIHRRVEFYGKEKLTIDAPLILAPNHSNTLMDPMAVLFSTRKIKVFVARADIFKTAWAVKALTFLKMLPINRIRDGVKSLSKNEEINDMVVGLLREDIYFCIFAEGTHQMKHSLLPLGKGICRIAVQASSEFGEKRPVYIAPMGIEYGHYTRFRTSVLVQVGDLFNVTQFIENHAHLGQPELLNALKDAVLIRMKEQILYIPNDEYYEGTMELCHLWSGKQKEHLKGKDKPLLNRFLSAKQTISDVSQYLQNQPEEAKKLIEDAKQFSIERHKKGIRIPSMHRKNPIANLFVKSILLIIGLPYFLFASVVSSPTTLLAEWLCTKFKDPAFHNTARFLIVLFINPIFLLIYLIVFFIVLRWYLALVAMVLIVPSVIYVYDYLRWLRLLISDIKWLRSKSLRNEFAKFANW